MTPTAAELHLKGTVSGDKHEILFSQFGINYNNEPEVYKKGSVIYRDYAAVGGPVKVDAGPGDKVSRSKLEKVRKRTMKAEIVVVHVDIIKDGFWEDKPWLLED